jgi:hypothetical protein
MTITVTKIAPGRYNVASNGYSLGRIEKRNSLWALKLGKTREFDTFLQARNAAFKVGNRIEERSKSPEVTAAVNAMVLPNDPPRLAPTPKVQPIKPYAVRGKRADRLAFRPFRYGVQLATNVSAFAGGVIAAYSTLIILFGA